MDFHSILLWLHNMYTYMYQNCFTYNFHSLLHHHTQSHFEYFLGFTASCTDYAMCIHITNPNILTPSVASRKRCHFTVLVKSPTAQQNSCFSPTTIPVHDFYLPPTTHPTHTHSSPLLWIYIRPPALTIECLHMLQLVIYSPHQ